MPELFVVYIVLFQAQAKDALRQAKHLGCLDNLAVAVVHGVDNAGLFKLVQMFLQGGICIVLLRLAAFLVLFCVDMHALWQMLRQNQALLP